MKHKKMIISVLLILLCCTVSNYAQQNRLAEAMERISKTNAIIKEKGYKWKAGQTSISLLSKDELKQLCGIISDTTFNPLEQKQYGESLYQEWKKPQGNVLYKTLSFNWQGWMSDIEYQECGNCWAHAATGVAEGLLHYLYGQNINIDLDEMEITDNATCADGCDGCPYSTVQCGLFYIKNYEVASENHEEFPNRTNAYYSIATYSKQAESISAIQTALISSPVWATMSVYTDFYDYSSGIYEYTSGSYEGDHAIVIVDYGNEGGTDYWVCKNSWGQGWGNGGYFKIKFGECGVDNYGAFVKATVNSNSFASFVPQFFSQPSTAVQNSKEGEITYVEGSCTLNSNVSVPSNKQLNIFECPPNSSILLVFVAVSTQPSSTSTSTPSSPSPPVHPLRRRRGGWRRGSAGHRDARVPSSRAIRGHPIRRRELGAGACPPRPGGGCPRRRPGVPARARSPARRSRCSCSWRSSGSAGGSGTGGLPRSVPSQNPASRGRVRGRGRTRAGGGPGCRRALPPGPGSARAGPDASPREPAGCRGRPGCPRSRPPAAPRGRGRTRGPPGPFPGFPPGRPAAGRT